LHSTGYHFLLDITSVIFYREFCAAEACRKTAPALKQQDEKEKKEWKRIILKE
jgi:hypothetical protein